MESDRMVSTFQQQAGLLSRASLLALALNACEQDPQWVTAPSPSIALAPSSSNGAGARATQPHDMDMRAGRNLRGDFAHEELVILTPPHSVPDSFRRKLAKVYDRYTELEDAFVAADSDRTNRAASSMRQAVEATAEGTLKPPARQAWAAHRQVLRTSLHQLTQQRSLESKRERFSHVSEALYCSLKSFGGIGRPVQVAYCATAHKGHGAYWLSNGREPENPYGGKGSCREIRETIGSPPGSVK